jgi:hypothetical protein
VNLALTYLLNHLNICFIFCQSSHIITTIVCSSAEMTWLIRLVLKLHSPCK